MLHLESKNPTSSEEYAKFCGYLYIKQIKYMYMCIYIVG